MQDANDHDLLFIVQIVDGIVAGETDAQTRRENFARRPGEREMTQRFAMILDLLDEAGRRGLGGLDSNGEPDFG